MYERGGRGGGGGGGVVVTAIRAWTSVESALLEVILSSTRRQVKSPNCTALPCPGGYLLNCIILLLISYISLSSLYTCRPKILTFERSEHVYALTLVKIYVQFLISLMFIREDLSALLSQVIQSRFT